MSNSFVAAYRCGDPEVLVEKLRFHLPTANVVANCPCFDQNADALIIYNGAAILVWIRTLRENPTDVYTKLGADLLCPWLQVSFFEHLVWQYEMYDVVSLIDEFVPAPEIWGLTEPKLGHSELIEQIWGVKATRVKKYFKRWDASLKARKAYFWNDRYCYKRPEQGFDFLFAITGLRFPA
jgi:hypothetical protein